MKKHKKLILLLILAGAAILIYIFSSRTEDYDQSKNLEPMPDAEVTTDEDDNEQLVRATPSKIVPSAQHPAVSSYISETSVESTVIPESIDSVATEEALVQREITKAEIAAKYSSTGDGTLTEADMRRYAEERYLKRRDLNGNGKLDGFELRAITQDKSSETEPVEFEQNYSRER